MAKDNDTIIAAAPGTEVTLLSPLINYSDEIYAVQSWQVPVVAWRIAPDSCEAIPIYPEGTLEADSPKFLQTPDGQYVMLGFTIPVADSLDELKARYLEQWLAEEEALTAGPVKPKRKRTKATAKQPATEAEATA
jgi:hypothetical protein